MRLEAANSPALRRLREMNQLPAPPSGPHVTPGKGGGVGGTALSHRRSSPLPPPTLVVPRVVPSARRHLLGKQVPPPGLRVPLGLASCLLLLTGARFPGSPSLFPGLREPLADPEENRGPGRLRLPHHAPPRPHHSPRPFPSHAPVRPLTPLRSSASLRCGSQRRRGPGARERGASRAAFPERGPPWPSPRCSVWMTTT